MAGAVAALASAALLLVAYEIGPDPRLQLAAATATAVGWAAVAAVAWSRYRSSMDPQYLYLSAGGTSLAVGAALYSVGYSFAIDLPRVLAGGGPPGPIRLNPFPVIGWLVTWLIAAVAFVLALPWRDRRGRAPVRPGSVFGATVLALAASLPAAFLLADLVRDDLPWRAFDLAEPGLARYTLGLPGWIVGEVTAALIAVAAFREAARGGGVRAGHPWFVVGFLLGVPLQAAVLQYPLQGTGFPTWADAIQPAIPVVVLIGVMLAHHEEVSRARRATDRATEVLDGRAEIASVLAHDVRSPVATIKSLATTTTQSWERLSDPERTEFVGLIEQEASRLLDTVNQASLALKVDARTVVHERHPVDLAAVVLEGIEAADVGEHELTADLAPGLTVSADHRHLAEMVRQLVDNAAKFSPPDGPITVSTTERDGAAVIDVVDAGPGIPVERRHEVTQRFTSWRPDGYEDRPGPGLGLFITCGIAAEHGAEVAIGDAPGGGTILRITFPLED